MEQVKPKDSQTGLDRAFEAEERTRLILESIQDYAILMLDTAGRVQSWNTGARRILGYEEREILGQHFSLFYPEEGRTADAWERELRAARETGRFEENAWRVRKNGERFWANVVVTTVRDRTGALVGYAKVTRDLTERLRAEEALRQSEERIRMMVGSVRDYAIFMLDADGRVATWNEGARRIKLYTPEEIIGSHLSRFYTEADRKAGRPEMLLERARREGRVEDEGWRVKKDGTRFWADVIITPLYDSAGVLRGYTKVTRDLTARREADERLRQSEERFRQLVETVSDYAIFMIDPEGNITTWNEGARRIKGYEASEIIGKNISTFYTPEDRAAGLTRRLLEAARRDGRVEDEGWRVRKDGTRFWADVIITALYDREGNVRGYSKVTRDLTSRRKTEEDRLRLAHAEEALRLRDEFLSIASHELKTPLTSLLLQLDSVRDRFQGDEKTRKGLDRAARSGERLTELVETLLDVSRIATGRFELSRAEHDVGEVVSETVERMRPEAERASCELHVAAEPGLRGSVDRLRVEQIVTNLVSNAVKYAAGTRIDVSVRRNGDAAVIEVQDRGPGVAEADLQRIFGRFERAASMRHFGGLGLGLYVTRQIVEAHGGRVSAANRPEGGARFTAHLPLQAPTAREN